MTKKVATYAPINRPKSNGASLRTTPVAEQHNAAEQQQYHADADRLTMQPDAYDGITACLQCRGDKEEAQNNTFLHGTTLLIIRLRRILPVRG